LLPWTTAKVLRSLPSPSAPGRRRRIAVDQKGESEMMLLEPIFRIIDRGYVLRFFRAGGWKPWCVVYQSDWGRSPCAETGNLWATPMAGLRDREWSDDRLFDKQLIAGSNEKQLFWTILSLYLFMKIFVA
jgi:hypothetical protein